MRRKQEAGPGRSSSGRASSPLFSGVRGIGILGSPYTRYWITPPNTPVQRPLAPRIHVAGGRYYLRLDSYARSCIGPGEPTSRGDLLQPRLPRGFLENQRLVGHPSKRGYSHRKGGEAGWLAVSGKAKSIQKAGAGGHAPLLRSRPRDPSGRPLSGTPSGRPLLSRRVAAGAPRKPPFTKRITKRSGDRGAPPNSSAIHRGWLECPSHRGGTHPIRSFSLLKGHRPGAARARLSPELPPAPLFGVLIYRTSFSTREPAARAGVLCLRVGLRHGCLSLAPVARRRRSQAILAAVRAPVLLPQTGGALPSPYRRRPLRAILAALGEPLDGAAARRARALPLPASGAPPPALPGGWIGPSRLSPTGSAVR